MTLAARRQRSGIADLEIARRLERLPAMCELLLAGQHNDENNPELVFRGLPFASVVRQAALDPTVALCLRKYGAAGRWSDDL